ncbi:solute carrier family 23 member 2 [Frankliniella occidentalis]|uniref:Solute carrier family 23 member 2 n=1 Tax=Frankliniella occidentalis TaxID=133901 RepID=A0A6J1S0F2_FRAOC|nr:solute carrier family 23 member 2 [Frankliniella occidentalis]
MAMEPPLLAVEGVTAPCCLEEHPSDQYFILTMDTKVADEGAANLQEKPGIEALHVRALLERAQAEALAEACLEDACPACPAAARAQGLPAAPARPAHLLYGLHDQPPALVVLLLAVQHCLLALLPCLLVVDCLSPVLCLHSEDPARAELLCRLLLATALATLVNNTSAGLGIGLVQGPCVASIAAALLVADHGLGQDDQGEDVETAACPSLADQFAMGHENMKPVWQPRARRVQAVLLVASALSVAMSAAGLPRLIARFQTPITAAVATFLSALPLVGYTINAASGNWIGALSGALGVLVCGVALRCLSVPVPVCSVRRGGLRARVLPAVSLLCVLVTLLVGWSACALLTAAGLVSPSNRLVTSEWREDRVHAREVFAIPWPAPWGWPSLSGVSWEVVASAVAAALVANTTASLTTFYAAGASASVGRAPDGRELQRGTLVGGGVSFLAAFWGALSLVGGGQETPGVIPLTQAGPVTAARLAGALLLALSFFPALAAGLASIPQPLLAGVGLAVLGAGAGQGLTYLRGTDLKSARNCIVLGTSVLTGVCVAGRLGLPTLSADARAARLEGVDSVDAVAAAVVAASPLAGAALSLLLEALLPLPMALLERARMTRPSPV